MKARPFSRVLQLWIPTLFVLVSAAVVGQEVQGLHVPQLLIVAVSSLLGIIAVLLFRSELSWSTSIAWMNFAVLFLINALMGVVFPLLSRWLEPFSRDADVYIYQYFTSFYFLMLGISVTYLLIERVSSTISSLRRFAIAVLIIALPWTILFNDYLVNARYLFDIRASQQIDEIKRTVEALRAQGNPNPSVRDVVDSSRMNLLGPDVRLLNEGNVIKILPYALGNNDAALFYRPFWTSCAWMSALVVVLMLGFLLLRYFRDFPSSAYAEKISWLLVPYVFVEALHYFVLVEAKSWDAAMAFLRIGGTITFIIMIPLTYLFYLKLKFLNSIEGNYYESKLVESSAGITRWRDALDNWIIRQFMHDAELNRRFLIRDDFRQQRDSEE